VIFAPDRFSQEKNDNYLWALAFQIVDWPLGTESLPVMWGKMVLPLMKPIMLRAWALPGNR